MRRLSIVAGSGAVLGALSLAGGALLMTGTVAGAASPAVTVGSPTNRFSPNVTTISVGDTVTFNWAAGSHVVDLEDVSPDLPINSGQTSGVTEAFTTPGTYYYYCSIHASEALATEEHVQAGDAMVGKIVVTAAETATATATTTTPSATATTPSATATTPAATATTPAATATTPPSGPGSTTATATKTATVIAPQPPNTGTGTSESSPWPLFFVVTGIALLAVSVGGGWLTVRNR
jgi:plastocyanin